MAASPDTRTPSPRDLKAIIEAERTGLPFIHWRDGEGQQHILMLTAARTRVIVGRREQSDVALTWDPEVSRPHAVIEPVGEDWTLVDDGMSKNGSFVNGGRIHGRHRLDDRDRMCFGNTHVVYHGRSDGRGSQSTARAQESPAGVRLTEAQRRILIALCRPIVEETSATPATNPQIADEVHLSVDAVKAHLRTLFDNFGLADLPQNEKRSRLASTVLNSGILPPHDF
jgi:DNA-binding CsgD family transcriptional regulator